MTVIDKIREGSNEFASNLAVIEDDRTWTHAELWDRVDRLSAALGASGLCKGDVLLAWLPNAHEAIECELACLQCGYLWVTLNQRATWHEVQGVIRSTGAKALVTDAHGFESLANERESLGDMPVLVIGNDAIADGAVGYESAIAQSEPERPALQIDPDDIARLRYTSGTTGSAKAAILPHSVYEASLRNLQTELHSLNASDRVLHAAPLTHASGAMMFPILAAGGANVLMSKFDADAVLATIEREKISTIFAVPTMLLRMIASPRFAEADLGSLRTIMYGGAPMAVERLEPLIKKCPGVLVHILGMTEAPYPICTLGREEHWVGNPRLGAVGKATTVCEVRLFDENETVVSPGEVGEIWIRGENVMSGYWRDAEATRDVFCGDWLKSGDLAVCDDKGFIRIVGRKKDVIISGGFNVYPEGVEKLLCTFEGVAEAAVVGKPDPDWGEIVVAYLVAKPATSIDLDAIARFCEAELASYERPRRFTLLGELPKNASGKIVKQNLAQRT